MIIEIRQTHRELYEDEFIIKCNAGKLGDVKVAGHLGSREAKVTINYGDNVIVMQPGKMMRLNKGDKPFRPYILALNERQVGGVYVSDSPDGGFFSKYCLYRLAINGKIYTMFPIGFGEQGAKNPIYMGETQVSEIGIPCVTYDDLRIYTLYVSENQDILPGILFCCSIFVIAHFHPGSKTIFGERKVVTVDKNKNLLAKYNPNFIKHIQP